MAKITNISCGTLVVGRFRIPAGSSAPVVPYTDSEQAGFDSFVAKGFMKVEKAEAAEAPKAEASKVEAKTVKVEDTDKKSVDKKASK